ncbi:MAG: hypothetical protein ACYCSS_08565 [Sulfuriferula sp.]
MGLELGVAHDNSVWVGVAYSDQSGIPRINLRLSAVERMGPQSGGVNNDRKVSERRLKTDLVLIMPSDCPL